VFATPLGGRRRLGDATWSRHAPERWHHKDRENKENSIERTMPLTPSILGTRTHNSAPSRSATPSTYQVDIVQTMRVTSDEPLTSGTIDQIKKRLERVLHHDLGGYTSGDETKLSITQTSLNVVRAAGSRDRTLSSPPPPSRALKTVGARPVPAAPQSPKRILFYHAHDPHYGFTNFSSDPVEYQGKIYPTSEHLFQSLKVSRYRGIAFRT